MIRAVIDTNVLVSGMISKTGNEALVILAVNQSLLRPCLSAEILQEYRDVLVPPKFAFPVDDVDALLAMLRSQGEHIVPPSVPRLSPDPEDDKFIACSLAGKADFPVTGNKRHFPAPQLTSTKVVSAAELLELITLEL
ncbi:MAG TPA: putative toxin-antitoxin system toxin component, PIN family [Terriglobales bacterium]|nr:putative toxin-antitoxin system toxin component, PIN family [Terriglobales bacterium]